MCLKSQETSYIPSQDNSMGQLHRAQKNKHRQTVCGCAGRLDNN